MKKAFFLYLAIVLIALPVYADHISGGEMFYTYEGLVNGVHRYSFTLKFYMRCNSGRQFNNPARVAIFEKGTGRQIMVVEAPLSNAETLDRQERDDCITNPPNVCY